MAEKPGVMLYREPWLGLAASTEFPEVFDALARAALLYAFTGEAPDLSGVALLFWPSIKASMDRDQDQYDLVVLKRRYARYCQEEQKHKREPLGFEDWLETLTDVGICQQEPSNADECPPISITTSKSAATSESTATSQTKTKTSSYSTQGETEEQKEGAGEKGETTASRYGVSSERASEQKRELARALGFES